METFESLTHGSLLLQKQKKETHDPTHLVWPPVLRPRKK